MNLKCVYFLAITMICVANVYGQQQAKQYDRKIFLPAFYHYGATHNGDTTFRFALYNDRHNEVSLNTMQSIDAIEHISYEGEYHRSPNNGGSISAPLIIYTVFTYSKIDSATWEQSSKYTNDISHWKEHKNDIVKTDTVTMMDPVTRTMQPFIIKYYRVEEIKGMNKAPHEHVHKH